MAHPGLGRAAVRGISAGGSAQLLKLFIQLGSVAIMARLLTPEDFGLVAMVMAILGFAELFRDMGLSAAAIQAPSLSEKMRSNLWWLNVASGAVACLMALVAAPLIAIGFREPRLLPIGLALSVTFALSGATTQFRVSLTRRLQFGRLAVLDVAVQLVGTSTAIALALADLGYWALVGQQITASVFGLAAAWWAAGWMPRSYTRGLQTGRFVRFGGSVLGSTLIFALATTYDSILIGKFFGARDLGYYNRAINISRGPLKQLAAPLNAVLQPVLARTQDDDEKFALTGQLAQLAAGTLFGMITAFGVAAQREIVLVMLGPQWTEVSFLFACILVSTFFMTIGAVGSNMLVAKGKARGLFIITVWAALTDVAIISVGAGWGLAGVALAVAVSPALNWYLVLRWAQRETGINVRPLVGQGLVLMGLTAGAAFCARLVLQALSPSVQPIVRLALAALIVLLIFLSTLTFARVRAKVLSVWRIIAHRS